MKRTLTGIAAAAMVLGTVVPAAFASTTSSTVGGRKAISVNGTVVSNPFTRVAKDAGTPSSFIGVWYLGQAVKAAGGDYTWDPSTLTFSITAPGVDATTLNIPGGVGSGNSTIKVNGTVVKKVNSFAAQDPAGPASDVTTFMPIFYLGEIFSNLGGSSWDGNTFGFKNFATLTVSGNKDISIGGKDTLSVASKDASGNVTSVPASSVQWSVDGNGSAFVDSNGNFTATAAGVYNVTASYNGQTATAKVKVYGIASGLAVAATTDLVANNASEQTVTVNAVDANGNTVGNYNGTATVALTGSGIAITSGTDQAADYSAGTVTFKNGVATVVVTATNVAGTSNTVKFTSGDLKDVTGAYVTATGTINTVAQQATSVSVTVNGGTKYISNNQAGGPAGSATFTATILDQAGKSMLSGNYPITFALTGPATSTSPTSTAQVGSTPAQFTVNSQQGVGGVVTVTATSAGLTSGTASVQSVTVGAAKTVTLTQSASSVTADNAGTTFDAITVQAVDANGYPTSYTGSLQVALTQNGAASTGLGVANTVALTNGTGTINVSGTTSGAANNTAAGTYTLTVSDSSNTLTSATANVAVTPGVAKKLTVTPSSQTQMSIASPTVSIKASLTDAEGNAVAQSAVPVTFAVYQGNIGTAATQGTLGATTVNTDATGSAATTLTSQPYVGNKYWVAVSGTGLTSATTAEIDVVNVVANSVYATLTDGASSIATAGHTLTFNFGSKDQYGAQVNGDTYTLKLTGIQAQDATGAAVTATNQVAGVTVNNDGTLSGTYAALSGVTFKAWKAGTGSVVVTDNTAPTAPSTTVSVSINPGAQTGYAFFDSKGNNLSTNSTGLYDSFAVGTPTQVWLKPVDSQGNTTTVASNVPVNVYVYANGAQNIATGDFRLTSSGSTMNYVTLQPASAGVAVFFTNNSTTAADDNLTAHS